MSELSANPIRLPLLQQLLEGSLSDPTVMRATADPADYRILPWANMVKIGGQSLIDRGRAAVYPLLDEIVPNLSRHKMIIGTGAGTRARHIYSLAILNLTRKIGSHCLYLVQRQQRQDREKDDANPRQ